MAVYIFSDYTTHVLSLNLSFSVSPLSGTWALGPCLAWRLLAVPVPSPLGCPRPQSSWLSPSPVSSRATNPVSAVLPAAMEPWPVYQTCYLVPELLFSNPLRPSLPHLLSRPLNAWLWKSTWHFLLRCWPVAPSITTMIITGCTLIISTRHSQKRTGHPSEPGSSLGFFLGSCISREFSTSALLALWGFRLGFCISTLWHLLMQKGLYKYIWLINWLID